MDSPARDVKRRLISVLKNLVLEACVWINSSDMNVYVSLDGLGLTATLTSTTVPTTRVRTMVYVSTRSAGTRVSARLDSLAKIANTLWIIARMSPARMEEPVPATWMDLYVNADLDTPALLPARLRMMNAAPHLVILLALYNA